MAAIQRLVSSRDSHGDQHSAERIGERKQEARTARRECPCEPNGGRHPSTAGWYASCVTTGKGKNGVLFGQLGQ